MFKKILNWISAQKPAAPSLYQEAVFRYRVMKIPDASIYADILPVGVLFPRIETYEKELRKANRALEENVPYSIITNAVTDVLRCHFYLTHQDAFLDPSEMHAQFVESAIQFLELYERSQDVLDQDKILQSNLYRLLPMVNNIMELSEALSPQ